MRDYSGLTIGQYKIINPLGTGGMASVYRGIQIHLERDVAIKFILSDNLTQDNSATLLQRFDREAKTLAKLSHPNIVKVIDYGSYENIPFIVMEYITDGTLRDQTGRPMNYTKAARLLLPIARALAYAHSQGIIHRDIKPGNILLTSSGEPMLSDFGIAKILDIAQENTLTGTNMGIGTPEYMAPEQWVNQISPQTDIYALGVVFYELITGRKPYTANTPAGVLIKQTTEVPPRPISLVPDLPVSVEQLILRAIAKKPEDRFTHMADFADALEELLRIAPTAPAKKTFTESPTVVYNQSQPTMAMPDQTPQDPAQTGQTKKGPWVWLLGGGAVGLFVGGGLLVVILLLVFLPSLIKPTATPLTANEPQKTATRRLSADLPGVSATQPAVEASPTQPRPTSKPKSTATQVPTRAVELSDVKIAFSSGPVNNSDAVLASGSGSGLNCLGCNQNNDETDPSISEDGSEMVFSANYNGTYDIYMVSSQGGKASALTTSTDQEESEADISSASNKIVYKVSPKGDPKGEGDFYIMNTSGGQKQSLGIHGRAPDWSPDGRQIAYMAREGSKSWQIYVYSLDTRSNQKVSSCPVNCRFPDWSPDMQSIAFNLTTSDDPSSTNPNGIAYVPANGGEMVTLISNENAGRPAWTQAGWIAFNTSKGIEMIKPDGSGRRTLLQGNYWGASWSR